MSRIKKVKQSKGREWLKTKILPSLNIKQPFQGTNLQERWVQLVKSRNRSHYQEEILELAKFIEQASKELNRTHPDTLLAYVRQAECLDWLGYRTRALDIINKVVWLQKYREQGQYIEFTIIFLDLISIYEKLGKRENANELILRLEEIVKAYDTEEIKILVNQRVRNLLSFGKLDQARELMSKNQSVEELKDGTIHFNIPEIRNEANLLLQLGKPQQAYNKINKVRLDLLKYIGPERKQYLAICSTYVTICYGIGEWKRGREVLKEIIEVHKNSMEDQRELSLLYGNLATLQFAMGLYSQARCNFKVALLLFPDDYKTAEYYLFQRDYAYCVAKTQNMKQGVRLLNKFLRNFRLTNEYAKQVFLRGVVLLAECLVEQDKLQDAFTLLKKHFKLNKELAESLIENRIQLLFKFCELVANISRTQKNKESWLILLRIATHFKTAEQARGMKILIHISHCLHRLGKLKESEEYLAEALNVARSKSYIKCAASQDERMQVMRDYEKLASFFNKKPNNLKLTAILSLKCFEESVKKLGFENEQTIKRAENCLRGLKQIYLVEEIVNLIRIILTECEQKRGRQDPTTIKYLMIFGAYLKGERGFQFAIQLFGRAKEAAAFLQLKEVEQTCDKEIIQCEEEQEKLRGSINGDLL